MAKILVIDDERAIRNTLKDILEFEGYTIDLAENGKVGLEKALATTYDLIYTDIKMPEMDGLEMLQAYRKTVKEQGLTIYISERLNEVYFKKVLCHELTHAAMFSYNIEMSHD